ncbi:MAG: RHS repeat-associated core domain-containing protein [Planctomycetaceae bacterium]
MPVTNYIWDPVTDAYLMEQDENGATTAVYTQEPVPYGNLISQRQTDPATNESHTYYHHYDALGSTRALTDEHETIVSTNLYDAWGVNVASTGTIKNPFLFTGNLGYYWDEELSSHYIRARNYAAIHGRWMSQDPFHFIHGANLYLAGMVPMLTDPSGAQPESSKRGGPGGTGVVTIKKCKYKVCTTAVAGGLGGHSFIWVDGTAFRAGPSKNGASSGTPEEELPKDPKCDCENWKSGRVVGHVGPFEEGHIDYKKGKPGGFDKCADVITNDHSCDDLVMCLRDVFTSLSGCCIEYAAFPDKKIKVDGNCNSAVVWALMLCTGRERELAKRLFPSDFRLEPGQDEPIPDCIRDALPGKAKL